MTEHRRVGQGNIRDPSGLIIRKADLSRARPVKWVWQHRILVGSPNLLIGEEGIGKGNLAAYLAARLTRGELPGNFEGQPRNVVFVGDEDSWDLTWGPRFEAAGADLGRLIQIVGGPDGEVLDTKKHATVIGRLLRRRKPALVYFDQLLDNIGYVDTWKDKQVRDVLAPLRAVVREYNCGLLLTMHPNKRGGSFRNRISGTPAFNALSRSSMLVSQHPSEPGRIVAVVAKANLAPEPDAFEFLISQGNLTVGDYRITTSMVAGEDYTDLRASELLAEGEQQRETKLDKAKEVISPYFRNGEVREAKDMLARMDAEGFHKRLAQEAKRELGLETWQEGKFQGQWLWGSPEAKKRWLKQRVTKREARKQ